MRALPLLILLAACTNTGTVSLGDKADDTGVTGDDTGAADDSGQDTEDTEPPPNAWSGDWESWVNITFPDWDYQFCEGELMLTVDDEGAMSGAGLCVDESNWGDREYEMFVEGEISDEGEISGVASVMVPNWGGDFDEYSGDIEGEGGEDSLEFTWTVELDWGGGGGSEAVGVAEGERL